MPWGSQAGTSKRALVQFHGGVDLHAMKSTRIRVTVYSWTDLLTPTSPPLHSTLLRESCA